MRERSANAHFFVWRSDTFQCITRVELTTTYVQAIVLRHDGEETPIMNCTVFDSIESIDFTDSVEPIESIES